MYSAPTTLPEWIQRGLPTTLRCPVYADDGRTLVEPASGTFALYRPDGTVCETGAVTVTEDVAVFTLTVDGSEELGERWVVLWTLEVDGVDLTFRREAAVVLQLLYCTVVETDLTEGRHRSLATLVAITGNTGLGDYIRRAWEDVVLELITDGRYPNKLLSVHALKLPTVFKALELIFGDAGSANEAYAATAEKYEKRFEQAWKAIVARWDDDEDGQADDTEEEESQPVSRAAVSRRTTTSRGWRT